MKFSTNRLTYSGVFLVLAYFRSGGRPKVAKKGAKGGILQVKQLKNGFTEIPPDNFSLKFVMVRVIVDVHSARFRHKSIVQFFYGRKTSFL